MHVKECRGLLDTTLATHLLCESHCTVGVTNQMGGGGCVEATGMPERR
jgi:hypothetical protein